MNQTLKEAIREVEQLPEAEQEELAEALLVMAVGKRIESAIAESDRRGGSTPHEVVFSRLKAKYAI